MRTYNIIIGSVPFFEEAVAGLSLEGDELSKKVEEFDRSHFAGRYRPARSLVIRNNHYHCLSEPALSRLGGLIEDLTLDNATITVHNPTTALLNYLKMQDRCEAIHFQKHIEKRSRIADIEGIEEKVQLVKRSILGQDAAVDELVRSLWYLSKTDRSRPFVMMLYGKSSLGKTETARALSDAFFDGNMIEKHLSMFETTAYADYLFGGKPNVRSLGYDLNERLSNLLFLDEIDKCNPVFHSAFYSLFDSNTYIDSTYEVDISGLVILLTCNYLSMSDIRDRLGDPIFFRIDKFIPYNDFSPQAVFDITKLEIERQLNRTQADLAFSEVYANASQIIGVSGENGRTIQAKVRSVIENMIYPG